MWSHGSHTWCTHLYGRKLRTKTYNFIVGSNKVGKMWKYLYPKIATFTVFKNDSVIHTHNTFWTLWIMSQWLISHVMKKNPIMTCHMMNIMCIKQNYTFGERPTTHLIKQIEIMAYNQWRSSTQNGQNLGIFSPFMEMSVHFWTSIEPILPPSCPYRKWSGYATAYNYAQMAPECTILH